jgi:hypothetical protein
LRRLKICSRDPETQLAIEAVLRAAGKDADTGGEGRLITATCTGSNPHTDRVHIDLLRSEPTPNIGSGLSGLSGEFAIECGAIHYCGRYALRID